nr:signal peptidase I [Desulfopila inferna]
MKLQSVEFEILIKTFFAEGHGVTVRSKGASMAPTVVEGAMVRILPITPDAVRLGDVVLFKKEGIGTIFHRVALKFRRNNRQYIQTWGDNVPHPDSCFPRSEILGKVVAYQINDIWYSLGNPRYFYLKFFLKRYGIYYFWRSLLRALGLLRKLLLITI